MKKHAWLILCLITVVAGLALSLTNMVTEEPIAQQKIKASNASRIAVFPDATGFEEQPLAEGTKLDSVYAALKDGAIAGYVLQTTVNGYGGPIEIVMGIDQHGVITGISVGGSNFAETAGLGTRTREPEFTDQFIGLNAAPVLKENIDGVSGATISSSAVTSGANRLYQYWQKLAGVATDEPAAETLTAANQKTVTVKGYASEFDVTVGINPDGTIEGVLIGGDGFNETEGLGAQVLEKAFRDQFKGKSGPVAYGDGIDAISGATITSNAVLGGINEALGTPAATQAAAATAAPAGETTALAAPDENGAVQLYTETVPVLNYTLKVTVGIDAQGQVASLAVSGANLGENEYFANEVISNTFRKQFIGKSGTLALGDGIDAASGATVSSEAVLQAVNNALAQSGTATAATEPAATAAPLNTVQVETLAAPNADGAVKICTETVKGFTSEIVVTVGLDANGVIVSLAIGGPKFAETEYYGATVRTNAFRKQFIGKTGTLVYGEGVDAVTGATVTSTAVLQAINDCLAQ